MRFKNPMKSNGLRDMAIEWALRSADKNKDKKISFEEYMNDFREAPGPNLAHYGEEFAEQEEQRFQEDLDLDGDGFIAGDELKYWLGPGIGSIGCRAPWCPIGQPFHFNTWAVRCVHPTICAPLSGLSCEARLRSEMRAGISCSAISISLRPI